MRMGGDVAMRKLAGKVRDGEGRRVAAEQRLKAGGEFLPEEVSAAQRVYVCCCCCCHHYCSPTHVASP